MAYLPAQSKLIMNSVSAAPGFKIKNVWVMAGVPKIMQAMFLDSVEPRLEKGKTFFSKTLSKSSVVTASLFSILDFSSYQVANGQRFDSKYTEKDSQFYLSRNPFSLDYLAWMIINQKRLDRGLSARKLKDALLFKYAEELGLGTSSNTLVKTISP